MYDDVVDLRDFYASSLGQMAQRVLRGQLRQLWPNLAGLDLLGLGYVTPFLRPFRSEARRAVACMPAGQGAIRWPAQEANAVALADDAELPFADQSFDRVLLVHALERTEQIKPMLRDVWRVLAADGRLLVIVPNRRGIWARLDRTPFGSGSPFTPGQLSRLLRDALFTPMHSSSALFAPPGRSRMLLTAAPAWEQLGRRYFPGLAGVLLAEAAKQIYALPNPRPARSRPRLLPALAPAPIRLGAASAAPERSVRPAVREGDGA